jgi:P-type conjugative transfer protein TrbJ
MKTKRTALILLVAATAALGRQGLRGGAVVGATEFTQIANNAELAASYSEQLQHTMQQQQMLANQLNAYRVQLQNIKKLDGLNWENASGALNQLARNVRRANGLAYAYATEDETFKALHRDYDAFVKTEYRNSTLAETYRQWSKFNAEAATRAAKAAGIAMSDAESEEARIRALKAAGATADGQLQAIMAGNALSAELLDQMRVLKQLLAQQIEAQARYQLIEQERTNKQTAQDATAMDDGSDDAPEAKGYGKMK